MLTAKVSDIRDDNTITINDRTYQLCQWGDVNDGSVTVGAQEDIPELWYTWTKREYITFDSDHHLLVTSSTYGVDKAPHAWAYQVKNKTPVLHNMRLMNFRRYSWSTAGNHPSCKGGGFCGGVVYANNITGGIPCENIEQVIRETMVRTVAEMRVPDVLKYHADVQPLYKELVAEALEWAKENPNYRGGARNALRGGNGVCGNVTVIRT